MGSIKITHIKRDKKSPKNELFEAEEMSIRPIEEMSTRFIEEMISPLPKED